MTTDERGQAVRECIEILERIRRDYCDKQGQVISEGDVNEAGEFAMDLAIAQVKTLFDSRVVQTSKSSSGHE